MLIAFRDLIVTDLNEKINWLFLL